jgi:geranylgeranyl transferase type-2 subunit beta
MSYLARLTMRLAAGAAQLPDPVRQCHAAYLARQRQPDGGFAGRQGPSDPYYTGFALRGLALLGALDDATAAAAADFLQRRLDTPMAAVDFLSLVASAVLLEAIASIDIFARAGQDRIATLATTLAPLARGDGGYAKTYRSGPSSTYLTFLVAATKELIDSPADDRPAMIELARSRQRPDGGFVELDGLRHSGTNPTAAAVGVLRLADALVEPTRRLAAQFLKAMPDGDGGFRASAVVPVTDLLSTFTGLVALADLDAVAMVDLAATSRYVESLAEPQGGFRGGPWDDSADVEYTFYGLGALALLAGSEN